MISLIRQFGSDLVAAFRALKGKKAESSEPQQPLAPLAQRLKLPVMPKGLCRADNVTFMMDVIWEKFPSGKISRRVLGKITRHYGVDLRGYGLFQAIPGRPKMLKFRLAKA